MTFDTWWKRYSEWAGVENRVTHQRCWEQAQEAIERESAAAAYADRWIRRRFPEWQWIHVFVWLIHEAALLLFRPKTIA